MANVKYLDSVGTQALVTEMKTRLATKATQYSTMPTAAVGLLGQVVQFIGTTTSDFTQGDFYICGAVADSDPAEYEWVKITYSKDEVDSLISAAGHFEVVDELPTTDIKTNVIYLVPKTKQISGYTNGNTDPTYSNYAVIAVTEVNGAKALLIYTPVENSSDLYEYRDTIDDAAVVASFEQNVENGTPGFEAVTITALDPQENNVKDEYINLDGTSAGWEKIGDTELDLSDYVKFDDLTAITSAELAAMWDD